jgi:hypothetical protein
MRDASPVSCIIAFWFPHPGWQSVHLCRVNEHLSSAANLKQRRTAANGLLAKPEAFAEYSVGRLAASAVRDAKHEFLSRAAVSEGR